MKLFKNHNVNLYEKDLKDLEIQTYGDQREREYLEFKELELWLSELKKEVITKLNERSAKVKRMEVDIAFKEFVIGEKLKEVNMLIELLENLERKEELN